MFYTEALPEGRASVWIYLRRFFLERRFFFWFRPSRKAIVARTKPAILQSFSMMSSHFIISLWFTSFLILLYQTYLNITIVKIKNFLF